MRSLRHHAYKKCALNWNLLKGTWLRGRRKKTLKVSDNAHCKIKIPEDKPTVTEVMDTPDNSTFPNFHLIESFVKVPRQKCSPTRRIAHSGYDG